MKNIITIIVYLLTVSISAQKYKDSKLSPQERAEDLVKQLTINEKIGLLTDVSAPVERLGIKSYNWWNEALHGVARSGLATVFPQPIGMAASFHPELINDVYNAISDEARAKNTEYVLQGSSKRYQGLTMWTPNVNIFRDPRWGRGIETWGEDPYLTSVMGVEVVKGLQGPADTDYDKLHACAKHFAVHSGPEWNRHSFNAENIKPRELYETYLPAFKALVQEADVKEVMCAYNRFEGSPCCGSNQLLNSILREEWDFKGIVVADCGAIADFYNERGHQLFNTSIEASSHALLSGTDLDCGSTYKNLSKSVEAGLVKEKDIDVSVVRLLKARFELGEMDEIQQVSWSKIPYSVVASDKHDSLALQIARESIVLLKNKDNALPLQREGLKIAVTGPNANDSVMQWGNYHGTPRRTITILKGIEEALGGNGKHIYEKGCELADRTMMKSAFELCSTKGRKGFSALYWNTLDSIGSPVAVDQITTPFNFSTMGATTFCAGVELTDFSARYNSTFKAVHSGELVFDSYVCGVLNLYINGEHVKGIKTNHGGRKLVYKMKVEQGETYDIQLNFSYNMGDAQLNFDLGFQEEIDLDKSVAALNEADIVIFAGGISPSLEGEEMGVNIPGFKRGDRTNLQLPDVQKEYLNKLKDAGKKVIYLNCSGSPISMEGEIANCDAILQVWYPGQSGGKAIADVLFGEYNPTGKLPVTFYKDTTQLPDFENYNMTGRTYRYMLEKPGYPFGYGLSYSEFKLGSPKISAKKIKVGESVTLSLPVSNISKVDGDETIQVYLKKEQDNDGPVKTLRAFQRIHVSNGKTETVTINLNAKQLEWWNEKTNKMEMHPGKYKLLIGNSSITENLKELNLIIK